MKQVGSYRATSIFQTVLQGNWGRSIKENEDIEGKDPESITLKQRICNFISFSSYHQLSNYFVCLCPLEAFCFFFIVIFINKAPFVGTLSQEVCSLNNRLNHLLIVNEAR